MHRNSCNPTERGEWPITFAAREILKERFLKVKNSIRLATKKAHEDIEYVHQLRVSTRRAIAAIHVFDDVLPKKRTKQIVDELRRLRRAAGKARDLDVIRRSLEEGDEYSEKSKSTAIQEATRKRKSAQKLLKRASNRWKQGKVNSKIKKLMRRIRWRRPSKLPNFAAVAHAKLQAAVDDFFGASEDDLSEVCVLHDLRIQGKQVRYVLEITGFLYAPSQLDLIYNDLKEMQDKLGLLMDHVTSRANLAKWSATATGTKNRNRLRELSVIEDEMIQKSFQEFRDWWTHKRAAKLRCEFDRRLES